MAREDVEEYIAEASPDRYPEEWDADSYRDAGQPLAWDDEWGLTVRDVCDDRLEWGQSIEVFGFHIYPSSPDGDYIVQPDGYVNSAATFNASDIADPLQLVERLHRLSTLVWTEMNYEERKHAFKMMTSDPAEAEAEANAEQLAEEMDDGE